MLYMVVYDLNAPGQRYQDIEDSIVRLSCGRCWRCLESTWLLETSKPISQVTALVTRSVDNGDEVMIVDVTGKCVGGQVLQDAEDWIRENVEARLCENLSSI